MKLSIKNFGTIEKADFQIDGITLIAAPNDGGKTTVLRLLYSLHDIFASTSFETIKDHYYRKLIREITHKDSRFRPIFNMINYSELNDQFFTISKNDTHKTRDAIHKAIYNQIIETHRLQYDFEDEDIPGTSITNNPEQLMSLIHEFISHFLAQQKINSSEPVKSYLLTKIRDIFKSLADNISLQGCEAMLTFEDTTNGLKDGDIQTKSTIEFPVDSKDSHTTVYFEDIGTISRYLNTPSRRMWGVTPASGIQYYTRKLIGSLRIESEKELKLSKSLLDKNFSPYNLEKSEDGENYFFSRKSSPDTRIEISNTPKGVLLISYIQKLLKNGILKKDSLLIIDEPENHLHQDWQAALAQFLYYVSVDYKIKIIMATHSPIIVETFEKIKKTKKASDIRFYNGSRGANGKVAYEDCTNNTLPIYTSFMSGFNLIDTITEEVANNDKSNKTTM